MLNGLKPMCFLLFLSSLSSSDAFGKKLQLTLSADTLAADTVSQDSINFLKQLNLINKRRVVRDSADMVIVETKPFSSTQQAIKGMITGVLVNENTSEPGREQALLVRGLKSPLLYKSDVFNQQPLVIMDGIPLISDHPFVYDIKKFDNINIGPATNYLANSDMDNINSIEVVKDPALLAEYGPLATNGVILITTKKAMVGNRQISLNSFIGSSLQESVTLVNGDYENRFRSQFYAKYANDAQKLNYAGYLRDSTNTDYYGPTNWHKQYYNNSLTHNVNLAITGGSERANFRFYGGANSTPGSADQTKLDRYNGSFYINMVPFKWLSMSSMVNVARLDRDRNRSFRDRYNETGYLPDVTTPLPPGGTVYQSFLNEYDKVIDNNINNLTKGYVSLNFNIIKNLSIKSQFSFDYNQSIRDVFWPTTLMETINFVSNYFGYNQRFNLTNKLNYKVDLDPKNSLSFDFGHVYWADKHKYNYSTAYDGPSDFIKVNVVQGNASSGGYLNPVGFMTYRYTDDIEHKMSSLYGNVKYAFNDILELGLTLRTDGSSNRSPDKRWYMSYAASAQANLTSVLNLGDNVDYFKIGGSFSRMGETFLTDQYAYGPQYRADLGWDEEPNMISYNGFATVSRPYTIGWISYDVKTPFSDKYNFNLNTSLFRNLLDLNLYLYSNTTKDMAIMTPVPQEYGFAGKMSSGMSVNNKGLEVQLAVNPIRSKNFHWKSAFMYSHNINTLKSLPNNLQSLVVRNRKLVIGESIFQFWLLENQGIINDAASIPRSSSGELMTFNGIDLQVGDPLWRDVNNDNLIDNEDKVLKGNMIAPTIAAWNNSFAYKNWRLDISATAHLGGDILNSSTANYYDFINNEQSNSLNSIKEIFHWQQQHKIDEYPIYSPWSAVMPYRKDQDLFLEDGSFAKLRSVSLGYDMTKLISSKTFRRFYVYATGMNLLTLSKFSGVDPEFIDLNGQYDGYGMPMSKTFLLGFKIDL
jgi:TonB-linked SusC/RagA family outer membrane protein